MPANFVKFDTEIEEPFRDENGRCVSAKAGTFNEICLKSSFLFANDSESKQIAAYER